VPPFIVKLTPIAKVDLGRIKIAHFATLIEGLDLWSEKYSRP